MNENAILRTIIPISLIGDSQTGKTCIVSTFNGIKFNEKNISSIGVDFLVKEIQMKNGIKLKLKIWDTAGQEIYHSMALNCLKNVLGIIYIFDVTNKNTLNSINKWVKEVNETIMADKLPSFLVGNKIDLEEDREVSQEEGENLAEQYGFKYMETSAKTNKNINELFIELAEDIYNNFKNEFPQPNIILNKNDQIKTEKKKCCGNSKKKNKNKNKNDIINNNDDIKEKE
jgi:Ras-related protein Rab-10